MFERLNETVCLMWQINHQSVDHDPSYQAGSKFKYYSEAVIHKTIKQILHRHMKVLKPFMVFLRKITDEGVEEQMTCTDPKEFSFKEYIL